MADETITRQLSERYARALATGEQICCPTRYPFEDLRRFYCGTPAGLATAPGPYTRPFVVIHPAGEPVAGEVLACGLGGSCW